MAAKPTILIQLDTDPQPSVFDGVVAVDAGRRPPVPPRRRDARDGPRPGLRGPVHARAGRPARHGDLHRRLERRGRRGGPRGRQRRRSSARFRVSVLFDANGCQHDRRRRRAGGARGHGRLARGRSRRRPRRPPGPVGQRVARLLGRLGRDGRRRLARASTGPQRSAEPAPRRHRRRRSTPSPRPTRTSSPRRSRAPTVVIAAGAAGVTLLPASVWQGLPGLKVAIDLNAVPPLGIEGVEATDKDADRDGVRPGARSASAGPR